MRFTGDFLDTCVVYRSYLYRSLSGYFHFPLESYENIHLPTFVYHLVSFLSGTFFEHLFNCRVILVSRPSDEIF